MKIIVKFQAGRRDGGGVMDCITCGTPIHQDHDGKVCIPGDEHWYDGHGEPGGFYPPRGGELHQHAPAKWDGPTLEFNDYVQVTYNAIRHETETVAYYDEVRGDWIIGEGFEGAGEAYSDVIINARP